MINARSATHTKPTEREIRSATQTTQKRHVT